MQRRRATRLLPAAIQRPVDGGEVGCRGPRGPRLTGPRGVDIVAGLAEGDALFLALFEPGKDRQHRLVEARLVGPVREGDRAPGRGPPPQDVELVLLPP